MDLYKEILVNILAHENAHVTFPGLNIDADKIVEMVCYNTLRNIKEIIEDNQLDDAECFRKIEEIIVEFEAIGSNGGIRHDF